MKHKLHFLLFTAALFVLGTSKAQYFQSSSITPGNPGGVNTDSDCIFLTNAPPAGSNILINYPTAHNYTLQYTPAQTLPFAWNFNGGPVTKYKISTSGYITFSKLANVPVGPANTALPAASLPDSSICMWGFGAAGLGGKIYTKVYGTAPNRQLWIVWWFAGNPSDTNSQGIWGMVLEETTNNIYLVDMWGNVLDANGVPFNNYHLTLGVQVNNATAYQVAASPNAITHTWSPGNAENIYYEFSPSAATAYTPQIKYPVMEEFTQASCDPCFHAMPNLDSVLVNNKVFCNPIRYHVWFPGVDYMDSVTYSPFVLNRISYYTGSPSVPDARVDGIDAYPGAGYYNSVSSTLIQDEEFIGSPFTINITSATFNPTSNLYSISADIKAFYSMPSGLIAQAVLTVDTMHYSYDQSTEDPGNGSPYLHYFPQTAEDMMPTYNGTGLTAFAINQTQTINLTWTKNHPWGSSLHTAHGAYDSTGTHITIFVQNNGTKYVYQSASKAITTLLGISEINNVSYFSIYPNPANTSATIAFALDQEDNVNIEMYNMLGEKVYSAEQGKMAAGDHMITLERGSLKAGIYFVRFTTNNGSVTKKLILE